MRSWQFNPFFYENTAKLKNGATAGNKKVLDIGNGEVINYKFGHFEKLVCGDLTISETAVKRYSGFDNVEFVQADILNLSNFTDAFFDTVIISTVIHHLAGSSLKITHQNVRKAISECLRVLKPGGQLLIVESTVNRAFECLEQMVYPLMQLFFRICKFGYVYQFSEKSLNAKLAESGCVVDYSRIDIDPNVWLMWKKIPTCLTPCGAVWARMVKE